MMTRRPSRAWAFALLALVLGCGSGPDGGVEPQAAPLEPPAPPFAPAPGAMPVVEKVPPAPVVAEAEAPAAEPVAPEKKNKKAAGKKKSGYPTLANRKALESILKTGGSAAGASGST